MSQDYKDPKYWSSVGIAKISPKIEGSYLCGKDFYSHYNLIHHHYYRVGEQSRKRKIFGSSNEKKCCLCDKQEPDVSFKKKAHILPESLGNKIYLSNEECDPCNNKFGNLFENEIAKYFIRNRILRGIKGSNSNPILKLKSGGTVSFDDKKGILIKKDDNDTSEVLNEDKNKFSLDLESIKVKPLNAFKSILKSAWLFMDPEQRERYPEVLELIQNDSNDKFKYYEFNLCGQITHPSLYIYESNDSTNTIPELIIRFDFVDTSVFWFFSRKNDIAVFPDIYFFRNRGNPKVNFQERHYSQYDHITLNQSKWLFNFGKIEKSTIDDNVKIREINPIKHSLPKNECVFKYNGFSISSNITFYRYDFEFAHAIIKGGDFPGSLEIYMNHQFDKQELFFKPNYRSISQKKLKKYLHFQRNMNQTRVMKLK